MYRFGSREITDVVFKAKTAMQMGKLKLGKMQPALYIDTATASSIEQSTSTSYANGGKGNTRLITWDGEKTVTFTVTDALLSPVGIAILTGAGILGGGTDPSDDSSYVHVHKTAVAKVEGTKVTFNGVADTKAPVFVMSYENDVIGGMLCKDTESATIKNENGVVTITLPKEADVERAFVDYYEVHKAIEVSEIQIDSSVFGGNFYVEANTLFRNEDGKDLPAVITIPNAKIQSNMTISMSASGDPSTFDFVMEAMPGYTIFDPTKKVMCVIQVVDEIIGDDSASDIHSVMGGAYDADANKTSEAAAEAADEIADSITGNTDYTIG